MIQTVFLVGGKGTRLGLTDRPKPMLDFDGKPLLERMVEGLVQQGITDFLFLTQHMSSFIENWFGSGEKYNARITYVEESEPLGTAGSVRHAQKYLQDEFLVVYGDVFFDIDVKRFIGRSRNNSSIGTLFIHPNDHPYDSDLVQVDSCSNIVRFFSKPHDPKLLMRNHVNAGMYYLRKKILKYIVERKGVQDFGKEVFPRVVNSGGNLSAYNSAEYIKDVGTVDRLSRAIHLWRENIPSIKSYQNKQKAVFIDRDGVINEEIDGVYRPEDMRLLPHVAEAIARLNASTFLSLCVTNQPGVAKGFVSLDMLDTVHAKMDTLLAASRAYLDDLYFCPHHPESGWDGEIPELKIPCECRKPKGGMLLQAARDHHIDLPRSFMIGDRTSDMIAGKAVGCSTIRICNNTDEAKVDSFSDHTFTTLAEAIDFILTN